MEQVEPIKKVPLRQRYEALIKEYGTIAIATYLGFSLLAIASFAVAIQMGIKLEGSIEPTGGLGLGATLGVAWAAAKVTIPLRIIGTLVMTPIIGKLLHKFRKPPPAISG